MGTHARRTAPWLVAVVLLVLAGALVAVQLRAAAAEQRRETVLAQEQAQAEADAQADAQAEAERVAAALAAARDEQESAVDGARAMAWTAAVRVAEAELSEARDLLAATDGEVDDADTREAVADASDEVQAVLDAAQREVAAVSAATAALRTASAELGAAHEDWLDARAEQEAAEQASSGYSGDCGGTGSYEKSTPSPNGLYTSVPDTDGDGSNGRLPRSAMSALGWCVDSLGHAQWLRSDAAAAMVRLNAEFRDRFGENIAIDLSYRSYADQVRARELFGGLAAEPGTSNHGWGTAIDTWEWRAYDFGSARHEWLVANGPTYGWYCPAATESANPEYWHFEYRG